MTAVLIYMPTMHTFSKKFSLSKYFSIYSGCVDISLPL